MKKMEYQKIHRAFWRLCEKQLGYTDTGFVNVELSSFNRRITGIEVKLYFMQMEPVTDTVKPRRLQAFFQTARERRSVSREYFLVIADQEDEGCQLHKYKFEIDISDMDSKRA